MAKLMHQDARPPTLREPAGRQPRIQTERVGGDIAEHDLGLLRQEVRDIRRRGKGKGGHQDAS